MAENKRIRRSPEQKWQDDIKAKEAEVKKAKDKYEDLIKELEALKANPPKAKSRKNVNTLIKELNPTATELTKIITEAAGDEEKLKDILLKAIESK